MRSVSVLTGQRFIERPVMSDHADKPDEERHGFGFTIRGDFTAVPVVDCTVDTETLGMRVVPTATCGMGVAYSVHPLEDNIGQGGATVRLRVHQWTPAATVTVTFSTKVEVSGTIVSATVCGMLTAVADDGATAPALDGSESDALSGLA